MSTPEPPRRGMPEAMLAFGLAIAVITLIVITALRH